MLIHLKLKYNINYYCRLQIHNDTVDTLNVRNNKHNEILI